MFFLCLLFCKTDPQKNFIDGYLWQLSILVFLMQAVATRGEFNLQLDAEDICLDQHWSYSTKNFRGQLVELCVHSQNQLPKIEPFRSVFQKCFSRLVVFFAGYYNMRLSTPVFQLTQADLTIESKLTFSICNHEQSIICYPSSANLTFSQFSTLIMSETKNKQDWGNHTSLWQFNHCPEDFAVLVFILYAQGSVFKNVCDQFQELTFDSQLVELSHTPVYQD